MIPQDRDRMLRIVKKLRIRVWLLAFFIAFIGVLGAVLAVYAMGSMGGSTGSGSAGGAGKGGGRPHGPPPAAVLGAAVKSGEFPVYFRGLGTVTPLNTVTVRSRVDGELMKLHFTEGQEVKAGDLLAEIDPRPFKADLAQAEGQLMSDQARLRNARQDLARYKVLLTQDSASPQQADAQEALVRQYEAAIKMGQGMIDAVRLQLTYCRITAPVDGRLGLKLVDQGNIIRASDPAGIVVITQMRPISVLFTVTESQLPRVLKGLREGRTLTVEAWDRTRTELLATGKLLTTDNRIDTATGTVRMKAVFDNADDALFPNQFVNARILVDTLRDVALAPTPAVQHSARGAFVYVAENGVAKLRDVTVGESDDAVTVLTGGVSAGEIVLVDGLDRLRDGSPVDVTLAGSGGRKPRQTPETPGDGKAAAAENAPPGAPPAGRPRNPGPGPRPAAP